jgi:membrane protein DedA with SNARE-associated domain
MEAWIIHILNQFGYWGIILLVIIENLFPPIPSEVILTFGGFMTTTTTMSIWGVISASTLGSVIGAIILYAVGCLLPPKRLEKWLNGRVGRMLHFKPGDVLKASNKFENLGQYSVFFCRMVPTIRSLISIPAGMAGMNVLKFLALSAFGSAIWNTVLVFMGAAAGASWPRIVGYINTYSTITIILIAAMILFCAFVIYKRRFAEKKARR